MNDRQKKHISKRRINFYSIDTKASGFIINFILPFHLSIYQLSWSRFFYNDKSRNSKIYQFGNLKSLYPTRMSKRFSLQMSKYFHICKYVDIFCILTFIIVEETPSDSFIYWIRKTCNMYTKVKMSGIIFPSVKI